MGLRFRKTINLGPFRMTASKSGISTGFGVKGARVTKMPNGSTRTTLSIPGTGISHVTESKGRKKSTPPIKRKGGTSVTAPVSDSCAAPVYPMTIRAVGIICCFIGVLFMGLLPLVSAFGILGGFYIIIKARSLADRMNEKNRLQGLAEANGADESMHG